MKKLTPITIAASQGPFWRWKCNFALGECPVDCLYCYVKNVYAKRYAWARGEQRIKTDLSKLDSVCSKFKWEAGPCLMYNGQWDIMISSTHDPLAPNALPIFREILTILNRYPEVINHVRVLSKCWGQSFLPYFLPIEPIYGATITTIDPIVSKEIQPNATLSCIKAEILPNTSIVNQFELLTIQQRKVWISSEPMLRGMDLRILAEQFYGLGVYPVEWWVGHLNYGGDTKQFALSDEEIIEQFEDVSESFDRTQWYLKTDVKGAEAIA